MQYFKKKGLLFLICSCLLLCCSGNKQETVQIENGKISLGFDKESGELKTFRDLTNSHNFLDQNITPGSPWEIDLFNSPEIEKFDIAAASDFSFTKPNPLTLVLIWKNFSSIGESNLQITAEVSLEENEPFSSWKISLDGFKEKQINKVVYPRIKGLKDLDSEHLAVPVWMGQLMKNPRSNLSSIQAKDKKFEWSYPGGLSMQLLTLYNPAEIGFYAAANDSLSYRKSFSFSLDTLNSLTYEVTNYPEIDENKNSYSTPYEAVIGSFKGDWITAANQYRKWGSKQNWAKKSRLINELSPSWLEETALWVWNREESDQVLSPAVELREELGLPVSVLWHWWHRDSYDDTFPEYFPPREGKNSFMSAVESAKAKGVNAIVYMNQLQWGTSTESFEGENATYYTVKDREGNMRSHVYNIFTGNSLTNMCIATDFWKDKYASLANKALNEYGVSGIYMDQACLSRMCYDPYHGHPLGGGNYWARNSSALTEMIRSGASKQIRPLLAGEGGLESYLPYLDVFLTLQVSRERYAGIGDWETIPLFQAVYHQYGITFGSYSSLLSPPYDDKWPEKYAPKEEQTLLKEEFNKQFLMEQARSFVWGMQPTIANYKNFLASERKEEIDFLKKLVKVRYKALEYLLHGKFVRTPNIKSPEDKIKISRLSIYAGRKDERVTSFEESYPLVYSQAWKSDDDHIGIALASISDEPFPADFNFNSDEYDITSSGEIFIIDAEGKRFVASYTDGNIDFDFTLQPKDICIVEIIPDS